MYSLGFGSQVVLVISTYVACTSGQCFYTGTCYTQHDRGISYRGHVNITRSGRACVLWSHQLHYMTPDRFPQANLVRNYCRNPGGSRDAPWCYTSPSGKEDSSWETCEIPKCDKCLFRGVQLKEGDRFHDGCSLCICRSTGLRCLECEGTTVTHELGCYSKYHLAETFPKCCPRVVCYGKSPDFQYDEFFAYMKLRLHMTSSQAGHQGHTYRQATLPRPGGSSGQGGQGTRTNQIGYESTVDRVQMRLP